jgi:thioredoxin-related protein
MILLFSKKECGPCILVKKYFKTMNDPRTEQIKEVLLDDGCSEEDLQLAKKYGVTATPTLLVIENEEKVEEYIGGVEIAQNITKILGTYTH